MGGTSLQVAPFCAVPNLAPRGSVRVLVNKVLSDCAQNDWSRQDRDWYGYAGSLGGSGLARSDPKMNIGPRKNVSLQPLWWDSRGSKRWQQLKVESCCDRFVQRFFSSPQARDQELTLET